MHRFNPGFQHGSCKTLNTSDDDCYVNTATVMVSSARACRQLQIAQTSFDKLSRAAEAVQKCACFDELAVILDTLLLHYCTKMLDRIHRCSCVDTVGELTFMALRLPWGRTQEQACSLLLQHTIPAPVPRLAHVIHSAMQVL
jgi:hypothetical protein